MKTVLLAVLLVVWVAALVGLSVWVWWRARRTGLDTKHAADRRRIVRDRRRPERDLERVSRQATTAGAVVVVSRRGSDPTRVTWSDGSVWLFFEDDERYLAARARGMAAAGATYVGEPPALGAQRTGAPRRPPGQQRES